MLRLRKTQVEIRQHLLLWCRGVIESGAADNYTALDEFDATPSADQPTLTITHSTAGQTISLSGPTETDTAQPIIRSPLSRLVNQIIETDLGQGFSSLKTMIFSQNLETDEAFQLQHRKSVTISQNSESDITNSFSKSKVLNFVQVNEADLPQPLQSIKALTFNQIQESDVSANISVLIPSSIATVVEGDC